MIRIAAAGDIHFDRHSSGRLSSHFDHLAENADLFLIAGDLTQTGHKEEGRILAEDLKHCPVPAVAVLGNHDFNLDQDQEIIQILRSNGVYILEREVVEFNIRGNTVGIAGLKGFGGGFIGACGSEFGEREMKSFIRYTREQARFLEKALNSLNCDYRIALLHYSPVEATLQGERREIYPFLGSYLLGEAIDKGRSDLAIHGHAHRGKEHGETPAGVPVRNVAQHVIRHIFNIYTLTTSRTLETIYDRMT